MPRLGIGMRWWLSLAFAFIAAVTALAVAQVFLDRSERAFRERAEELAVGNAVAAADAIERVAPRGGLDESVQVMAQRRRLALFVFDREGNLLTSGRSHRTEFAAVPQRAAALRRALAEERYSASLNDGRSIVVALPLEANQAAALVAYASRPELAAEVGIVREKIVEAVLWAVLVGAFAGLLVAMLIAARLRRIAAAAAAIEAGSFEKPLRPRFRDELGSLALTIDRMRERLRESFAALESDRDRLRRLLGRLHEGVVTVDDRLQVEFANAAARTMLGVRRLDEGDPLPDPWPDVSLRDLAAGLFRDRAPLAQARVSPDEERTYAVVGIPAGRGSHTAVLVLTDVTERERRERAEREFVTNAAHELRTPLTAIISAVEVLQSGAKEIPAERDRFLAAIERQSARLGRLARTLLVLARAETREEAPRLVPIELRPLLEEVAAALDPREGVTVEVECPAGLAVLAEHDLAVQALANLAANAAKHTEQGRIALSGRRRGGRSVVVEISDTGSGIPPHEHDRVFERFYRSREQDADGFGLGLAIVRQAVRAIGGTIELESSPGGGTTVRVTLPLAGEEAA
jgi:signal transduction histidine kinase/HAMP domain-containing protein